jgi:hypothetical protein
VCSWFNPFTHPLEVVGTGREINDVNFPQVVRSSYADPFYTQLARDAIREWKNEKEWGVGGYYHEFVASLFLSALV